MSHQWHVALAFGFDVWDLVIVGAVWIVTTAIGRELGTRLTMWLESRHTVPVVLHGGDKVDVTGHSRKEAKAVAAALASMSEDQLAEFFRRYGKQTTP